MLQGHILNADCSMSILLFSPGASFIQICSWRIEYLTLLYFERTLPQIIHATLVMDHNSGPKSQRNNLWTKITLLLQLTFEKSQEKVDKLHDP